MAVTTVPAVDVDTLARVGDALADPTRRAVLVHLLSGPDYPAEIAAALGVSRSVMSNHLACLRGCGFVTATYEGRRVRYALHGPEIADALTALAALPLGPCPEDGTP
ncbi:ArsR/SmtB family transcription factor [Actinospongicola halichondriae]|uniref:ArsR/SmtB family transcription factor n=1 Tax=Actinospongicola halichondriae TaxID=3236844 RepID=UPI003D3743EE